MNDIGIGISIRSHDPAGGVDPTGKNIDCAGRVKRGVLSVLEHEAVTSAVSVSIGP